MSGEEKRNSAQHVIDLTVAVEGLHRKIIILDALVAALIVQVTPDQKMAAHRLIDRAVATYTPLIKDQTGMEEANKEAMRRISEAYRSML